MICVEDTSLHKGPLYKPCNCNTLIHKECLIKLVDLTNSHYEKCPICLKEYDIIIKSKKFFYTFKNEHLLIFFLTYFASSMIIFVSIIFIIEFYKNFVYVFIISTFGILISLLPIIFIHYNYYKNTREFCCIQRKIKLIREINLQSPFTYTL